jgi:hypothetical protein
VPPNSVTYKIICNTDFHPLVMYYVKIWLVRYKAKKIQVVSIQFGVYIFSKCILCDFMYRIGLVIYLFINLFIADADLTVGLLKFISPSQH